MSLLYEHFARHEAEAKVEKFMDVPDGELARISSPERLARAITEPDWTRIWYVERDGMVVGHATLYEVGQGDLVFGGIGVERPYRGQRIARILQRLRDAFLDRHQLTLVGPIFPGNDISLRGCLATGFVVLPDQGDGKTWVCRYPVQPADRTE